MDTMNERNWIEQARGGDADAFCRLYGLYRSRLYRYAFYRLRSEKDAEDAVSECVLSAWKQIGSLRESEAFPAWIFRILSGCCGRLIRQQIRRREQISLDDPACRDYVAIGSVSGNAAGASIGSVTAAVGGPAGTVSDPATDIATAGGIETVCGAAEPADQSSLCSVSTGDAAGIDTWLILQEALAQLSEEDRNILLLSAVGGLKSREIAALTGLAAGSVRSRLSRSLKKVRGYLA